MTPVQIGEIAAMATALLWTISTLAWTSAGKRVGALPVSLIRLAITCVFLTGYGRIFHGLWLPTDATLETWYILGLSGFVGFFLGDLCLFKAFLLIGPRLSLLIQSLSPPIAAVVSWFFLCDELAPRHWLAMGVTLAGVTWVLLEQPESAGRRHKPRHVARGILLAVLGAGGQAVALVLSKRGIGDYDAVGATFIRVLGALVGYVLLTTILGRWPAIAAATRHARAMVLMTLGAFIGPFLGVALCMVALRNCHAGIVATIIGTMPVLILPFVIILGHEKVSLRAAEGALVSVLGVALLVL